MGCGASKGLMSSTSNISCMECGQQGHARFECPKLKQEGRLQEVVKRENSETKKVRARRSSVETYLG